MNYPTETYYDIGQIVATRNLLPIWNREHTLVSFRFIIAGFTKCPRRAPGCLKGCRTCLGLFDELNRFSFKDCGFVFYNASDFNLRFKILGYNATLLEEVLGEGCNLS